MGTRNISFVSEENPGCEPPSPPNMPQLGIPLVDVVSHSNSLAAYDEIPKESEKHDLKKPTPTDLCSIKESDKPKWKSDRFWMTFCMVVIGFLAFVALVIALLQFSGMLKCGQITVNVDSKSLLLLQSNIISLQMKMISQEKELERLKNLTDKCLQQINNISLTPGPQGPVGKSGAGNLSACYSETKSVSSAGGLGVVKTMPLNFDPDAMVVTGAYCFANNVVKYQYNRHSNYHQCTCQATNYDAYQCSIVAWYCPKNS